MEKIYRVNLYQKDVSVLVNLNLSELGEFRSKFLRSKCIGERIYAK